MGFGAILTTGDRSRPLGDDLMRWIVEARVEQELSKPTVFAVRFEDDLCGEQPAVAGSEDLKQGAVIGIFVESGGLKCLVQGPITRVRTSSMIGGTGSWVEVRGEDRRVEMDRVGILATWACKASEAAEQIIRAYGHEADCEETRKTYSEGTNTLSQRATDLAFLEEIARKNNLELWLSYTVTGPADALAVTTTVNVRSSPPRSAAPAAPGSSLLTPPILQPTVDQALRVQPPPSECASVTRFDTHVDFERPNSAYGFAQELESGRTAKQQANPTEEPLGEDRQSIVQVAGVRREALVEPVSDQQEHYLAQEALLTEASWFVTVDCSSTLELLGFPPEPHQIVDVKYAGKQLSGPYQVMKSTHIINAADHFVDFKIRANGLRSAGGVP